MKNIKITISSEDRLIIIPMIYNNETDDLNINEIQVEPVPDKNENISDDLVFNIAKLILNTLKQ